MKAIMKYLPYVVVAVVATFLSGEIAPWYRKGRAMLVKPGGAA